MIHAISMVSKIVARFMANLENLDLMNVVVLLNNEFEVKLSGGLQVSNSSCSSFFKRGRANRI